MYNFFLGVFNWDKYIEKIREESGLNDKRVNPITPWTKEVADFVFKEHGTKH